MVYIDLKLARCKMIPALLMQLLPSLISAGGMMGAAGINSMGNKGGGSMGGMQQQQRGGIPGIRTQDLGGNKNPQLAQVPTQTPQGQQALQMLLSQGMQGIQGMPKPQFGPIREAYEQDFKQNGLPSIAERFAALGEGAGSSSGFRNTMQSAEANMHTQLAGMEQQFNQQNLSQLMQMLGLGLTPQHETFYQPRQPQWWEGLLGGLGQGIGALGASYGATKLGNWAAGSNPSADTTPK